ncbi:MAG: SWIM zinc finger family protein [Defluviitaleaceae bacterium]|nr:SWIM zinc finger family protein [Defluviitaleaceae bacterium]
MNLKDFESHVDSKILERGKSYYRSGHIVALEFDGDEWVAEVDGSEEYTVTVNLSDEGLILNTYCDCPYDWGDYCKHQVAVFFALREKEQQPKQKTAKPKQNESLESILSKLDKQALVALIVEYAEIYKPMKSEIRFRYAENVDITKSARQVVRSAISAVKRRGHIEYHDTEAATDGAQSILRTMENKIDSNELLTAVSLGIIIAEEMMELLDYCDDSNGYVSGTISEAVEQMNSAILAMPQDYNDSGKIFDAIITHAASSTYSGWQDWRIDLLSSLVPFCHNKENRTRLEDYLSTHVNQKVSQWSYSYELRNKQMLRYKIINQFDGEEAAQHYVEQNLDNIDFRRKAIDTAITQGNYDRAISLCLDGENSNQQQAGIVKDLRDSRYTAYELMGNKPEQKKLALTMLMDRDFDYFLKYKSLHTKEEWVTELYNILDKTESKSGIYLEILVHEKHKPRLLAYCEKNPFAIDRYHKHLLPEYQHEVGQIFASHIRTTAERADSRSNYREVCKLIQACDKASPSATDSVCAEILLKYARKPAFMDEMRKIKKR